MKKILWTIISMLINIFRRFYLMNKRIKLRNKNFTIICNNCLAGMIYKDLNIKFLTPTINLWFENEDFLKFINNLEYYLSLTPKENKNLSKIMKYPVGIIDDINIYFMHYENFETAKEKWEERKLRINFQNIFVIFTENEKCSISILNKYDLSKYQNKILLTFNRYNNINSSRYIGGNKEGEFYYLLEYNGIFSIKKKYWIFNFIKWFNKGTKKI